MKISFILISLCCFSLALMSQNGKKAGMAALYHVTYTKEGKSIIDDECELISGKQSLFYSLKMEEFEKNILEAIDKSGETGGIINLNSANLNQSRNYLPVKILKDFSNKSVLFIEDFNGQTFGYKKENSTYSDWQILPDTISINHLHCQKAQIKNDSLLITAWFCPNIPIPDGPLSYFGLPGLIIKVENSRGWNFSLLSFSPEAKKPILPEKISYTLTTESKLLKAKKQHAEAFSNGQANFDGDIKTSARKKSN
jgi:GLPGLI family protein